MNSQQRFAVADWYEFIATDWNGFVATDWNEFVVKDWNVFTVSLHYAADKLAVVMNESNVIPAVRLCTSC